MGHFELWYQQNKVVISEPTVANIPDFFYPFTCKNLKPTTIAGFTAATADHLYLLRRSRAKAWIFIGLLQVFIERSPLLTEV